MILKRLFTWFQEGPTRDQIRHSERWEQMSSSANYQCNTFDRMARRCTITDLAISYYQTSAKYRRIKQYCEWRSNMALINKN
jgi:hypothetical protein